MLVNSALMPAVHGVSLDGYLAPRAASFEHRFAACIADDGVYDFAISVIGVLIFAGLTAWDTQRIKEMYSVQDDGTVAGRKAVMGALFNEAVKVMVGAFEKRARQLYGYAKK